jgi:YesN/AraC family two-component response regulator
LADIRYYSRFLSEAWNQLPGAAVSAIWGIPLQSEAIQKVLVVEDEPLIRMGLAISCEAAGFEVIEAGDGVDALTILSRDPGIRLVVTDVDMPRMDGLELSRMIAMKFPDVRIVLMSGMTLSRTSHFPEGVPFFEKPINDSALVACLRRLAQNLGE